MNVGAKGIAKFVKRGIILPSVIKIKKTSTSESEKHVIHPVVVVLVEGIKCRALLDTGSSSNYISSTLVELINKTPVRKDRKTTETLLGTSDKDINVYEVAISSVTKKW